MSDSKQHNPEKLPAMPDDAASGSLFDQQRPLPVDRAVFWYPVNGASQPPRARAYLRFITVGALREMANHVNAHPNEGRLGFLIGELFSCPDTNARYVVVDATVTAPHPVKRDRTMPPVDLCWPRLEEQLKLKRRHLIGWYHTHPRGGLTASASDLDTHSRYFTQPWQLAIILEPGIDAPRGMICEPDKRSPQNATLLPFYELLEPESLVAADGVRRAYFRWHNYRNDTPEPAEGAEPSIPRAAPLASELDPDASGSRVVMPRELDDAFDDRLHTRGRPRRRRRWAGITASLLILLLAGAAAVWKFVPWRPQLPPPAEAIQPAAVEPLIDPNLIRLDQLAGEVEAGVAGYEERARLFDNRQMTCTDLTRGLTHVLDRWMVYSVDGRAKVDDLDPSRADRDRALYANVQEVERHFRASNCPPP